MTEIEKAIERLRFGSPYPPASDEEIKKAQNLLGVTFPPEYIEFLKQWFGQFYYELPSALADGTRNTINTGL